VSLLLSSRFSSSDASVKMLSWHATSVRPKPILLLTQKITTLNVYYSLLYSMILHEIPLYSAGQMDLLLVLGIGWIIDFRHASGIDAVVCQITF